MENVTKLLRIAFYMSVFTLGISLLYLMSEKLRSTSERSADVIAEDKILYETPPTDQRDIALRAELISTLMEDITYDISIEDPSASYRLFVGSYHPEDIIGITLTGSWYEKSYVYNESGDIISILYHYISDS